MPAIPVLETERLTLRGHRLEDFCHVRRYVGRSYGDQGHVLEGEVSYRRGIPGAALLRYLGHWTLLGFGYWVVEEKATSLFVGEIGFADLKREMEGSLKDAPEIGWVLASRFHGRGYATEATLAAVAWGDAHFGPIQTTCIIDPENRASIRVAENCGYRELRRTTYRQQPALVFARRPNTLPPLAS